MNGCVGGEQPGEGRASQRSITAACCSSRLLRSTRLPLPRPRPGCVILCPGSSGAAALGGSGTGTGRGGGAAPPPLGSTRQPLAHRLGHPSAAGAKLEVLSLLEDPGPTLLCLGLVLRCPPTTTSLLRQPSPPLSGISECQYSMPLAFRRLSRPSRILQTHCL